MGMYSPDIPDPDPAVGEAATANSELGKKYLEWMQQRATVTDAWAKQDRSRDIKTFRPLQDRFIKTAQTWASPGRQAAAAREAGTDVAGEIARAQAASDRALAAAGVKPNSGRSTGVARSSGVERGLAIAGAKNMARRGVRDQALTLQGQAINMGSGLAINPLSSQNAGTSALGSGFNGAIGANDSAAGILNQDYANRLAASQASQQGTSDLFGALGMGAGLMFGSDEETKTGRKKERGILESVRKLPVDRYRYNPDAPLGDGGKADHVGTMAQDWQRETGLGDGKTIGIPDAIGVNLGAVKELDAGQQKLAKRLGGIERGLKRLEKMAA